jgi:hypothetical protein
MPIPFHRSPKQREDDIDIMAFPNNKDDIVRYLVDVAVELRNHVGATHAHKSRIKKELLDVVDMARKLQVTCVRTPLLSNNFVCCLSFAK